MFFFFGKKFFLEKKTAQKKKKLVDIVDFSLLMNRWSLPEKLSFSQSDLDNITIETGSPEIDENSTQQGWLYETIWLNENEITQPTLACWCRPNFWLKKSTHAFLCYLELRQGLLQFPIISNAKRRNLPMAKSNVSNKLEIKGCVKDWLPKSKIITTYLWAFKWLA